MAKSITHTECENRAFGHSRSEGASSVGLLICCAVVVGFFGLILFRSEQEITQIIGLPLVLIAGLAGLAGTIRWGIEGARLTQLDVLREQNERIIRILESQGTQDEPSGP